MKLEDRIRSKTLELFMKLGLRSVSMDDIARELGMSKKTIYKFFENKESLVHSIVLGYTRKEQRTLRAIRKASTNAVDEMLRVARHVTRMFRSMSPYVVYDLQKYYPQSWKTLQQLQSEFVYDTILENLKKGMAEGLYRKDICPGIIAKLYVGKTFFLVDEAHFPLKDFDRDQLFVEAIRYHLFGILSDEGKQLLTTYMSEEE